MFNSHKDSAYSLALNIIDGCAQVQGLQNKKGIGQDINQSNVKDMFRTACSLAQAMMNIPIYGLYYELPISLYLTQLEGSTYYDPVRRLHMLTKYKENHTKIEGKWPLPFPTKREAIEDLRAEYYYRIHNPYFVPLSYVPDIDSHWLCPEEVFKSVRMIDVFEELDTALPDMLFAIQDGVSGIEFPRMLSSIDGWLRRILAETDSYEIPATLYLMYFFPVRCSRILLGRDTVSLRWVWNAMGLEEAQIDYYELMDALMLPLLKYGPTAIRLWIKQKIRKDTRPFSDD